MTSRDESGVVVDTMIVSWLLNERSTPVAERYRALLGDRAVLLAFQTVVELRYGALKAGWGELRRRRLERRIDDATVVQPDDHAINVCAELRDQCRRAGHPLADKLHDGDRWIAAVAVRLGVPLMSDDVVFRSTPRLELIR
jgi:predicted nucleic acid-binding protein